MDETTEQATPLYVPPSAEKKAFLAALAAAQGEFPPILRERTVRIKQREGPEYTFKYAELGTIIAAVRPALAKNGLSLRSRIVPAQAPGFVWLQSVLAHSEGYEDIVELQIQVASDMKLFGGQLTYARRYLGSGQLGIASEDDDDENGTAAGAGTSNVGTGARPPAPSPAPRPQQRPPAEGAQAPAGGVNVDTQAKPITAALAKWLGDQLDSRNLPPEVVDQMFVAAGAVAGTEPAKLTLEAGNNLRTALMKL